MQQLRGLFTETLLAAMADSLDDDERDLRASLVSSQVIGVAMARYVWRIGRLAEISSAEVADHIAPTIQRYLTDPL